MRVLFATAEFEGAVKVGGLGEAARGLVRALRSRGVDVEVVVPDYGDLPVESLSGEVAVDMPSWVGSATRRSAKTTGGDELTLIRVPGIERPHPYNEPSSGRAWGDNDRRFFAFSAAVAALADADAPDVVHLNDWHTALAPALMHRHLPSMISLHNATHQGMADARWVDVTRRFGDRYLDGGSFNPVAGAVSTCERVVAVSAGYADELRAGAVPNLADRLRRRGAGFVGIRNGIDTDYWDPAINVHLAAPFEAADLSGKEICRKELVGLTTLAEDSEPVIAMVGRLVEQKGFDLALDVVPFLDAIGAKLVIIGDGEMELVARAARTAGRHAGRVHFFGQYSDALAAKVIAGADFLVTPSRFEPCGLTQMQAMRMGTIPIVTDVGGLGDTVIDADRDDAGNGFIAATPDATNLVDAIHRAVRAFGDPARSATIRRLGMVAEWSWRPQAARYVDVYDQLVGEAVGNGAS